MSCDIISCLFLHYDRVYYIARGLGLVAGAVLDGVRLLFV